MKPAAPAVLRKGSVIRIGGGPESAGAAAIALSYVDLRFDDGRVERWLGPGELGNFPGGGDAMKAVQAWGEEVIDVQAECLVEELAMSFSDVSGASLTRAPVEIVVEWNAELDLPGGEPCQLSV